MARAHANYDDAPEYDADAYTVKGYRGIAWYVRGWETAPDEDTEWSGIEERTGQLSMTMIGDDRRFSIDPADVAPLDAHAYCASCGQIGCTHDGRDRS